MRPTQINRQFPKPKYNFTHHLKNVGDWVETEPLGKKEYYNFLAASHFWAWRRGWVVVCSSTPDGTGKKYVRLTLTAKHRERDYG